MLGHYCNNCLIYVIFPVFGMLLGDTLILDTLDDANSYRGEVLCTVFTVGYLYSSPSLNGHALERTASLEIAQP